MLTTLRDAVAYARVFRTPLDIQRFRAVRNRTGVYTWPVPVRVRGVSGQQWMRPGTVDPTTLLDTFWRRYHLPLAPVGRQPVIVDLGANAGYTVAHFAARHPRGRIIGIELDMHNAEMACRNTADCANVSILHAGIAPTSGEMTYGGPDVDGYALGHGTKKAPVLSPADLASHFGLGQIDYCKMDIEGAEIDVLPLCLRDWDVRQIVVEVHQPSTREWAADILTGAGFVPAFHPTHHRAVFGVRH